MSEPGAKRKRPPTFQHFPADRAKKLKKTWVETAKIRSKWKAEKRKQKLAEESKSDLPKYNNEGDDEENGDNENSNVDERVESQNNSENEGSSEEKESPNVVQAPTSHHTIHPSRAQIKPKRGPKLEPTRLSNLKQKEKGNEEQLSVRELTRLAYSSSTLHTYKKRKRKGGGRGQPDMKLRMNAMLAKIKQDIGS
ncbi:hypothetical protein BDQ17DRAFT_1397712 [Cyathus striatus]|nr:hypothetical protein BDQ17DRAFT_1397712 [Cyathus striatus]